MANIAVIGAGYVGLTTAACFAHTGHHVVCADLDAVRIERLNRGDVPIHEEGLEALVREGLRAGRLKFVLGAASAVPGADFVFLCVPTPSRPDGRVELGFVERAAREVGPLLEDHTIVVDKSTVPVGTTRFVSSAIGRANPVVSNPEFLREGSAVRDILQPDRIVVGSTDRRAAEAVADLHPDTRRIVTDPSSAELIKYASNAFLATKISFANAVANLCEQMGADAADVLDGMGSDARIGHAFLRPGPGWGGSCFPKDTVGLLRTAEDAGYTFSLLESAVAVNDAQQARIVEKVRRACGGSLLGAHVAVWGLTYKAGTDDTRRSPSFAICDRLGEFGATVRAHDPAASATPADVHRVDDPLAACDGADALLVATEWDAYASVDPAAVVERLRTPHVVDARNVLARDRWEAAGAHVWSVGRPAGRS